MYIYRNMFYLWCVQCQHPYVITHTHKTFLISVPLSAFLCIVIILTSCYLFMASWIHNAVVFWAHMLCLPVYHMIPAKFCAELLFPHILENVLLWIPRITRKRPIMIFLIVLHNYEAVDVHIMFKPFYWFVSLFSHVLVLCYINLHIWMLILFQHQDWIRIFRIILFL